MNPTESDESSQSAPAGARPEPRDPNALDETMCSGGETSRMSVHAALPERPDAWVGRQLGKYRIIELLGIGGMGVVLRGHDPSIGRDVAIKVLPANVAEDGVALQRFQAEAKSAGQLCHPNTVTVHEVAQDGQTHYLVMELVTGGSASDHLERKGAYSVGEATRMIIEACKGLAAAHGRGLIHRDVKPANLLLTEDGTVKVSDFGLAKQTQNESLQMTQAGQIMGTPYYMSPEQCDSRPVDVRSDIYSLGATYYSLLTGKNPFEDSGGVVQIMFAHCNASRPDPRDVCSGVPAACGKIIERAMATDPEQRYQTMEAMRADLEAVLAAISGAGINLPSQSGANLPAPPAGAAARRRRLPGMVLAGLAAALAVAVMAVVYMWASSGRQDGAPGEAKGRGGALPSVAAPPSGEPIKIGVLHSLSGTMADSESPVADAALLAVEELNRGGGVLGRPVVAVVADGRSDSATFAREARRLIEQERVCTVFGCWTSSSRKTVVPVFEELDHLLVYPVQYEGIEESPNVIYTGAAPNQQIIPAVKWAFAFENKRRFFLVGSDYVFPRVAHEIIKDQLQELGAVLAGEEFLELGSVETQAIVDKIKAAKPDVILNSINGDSNVAFFRELRKAGVTPQTVPTISFSIGEEELRHMNVAAMVGDYAAANYFQSVASPENQKFVAGFRRKFGPQRVLTDPMEAEYFSVKLWAKAVAEAKSAEPAEIRRAMRNQRIMSPGGEVRIDPATQHTFKTPRVGRVQPDGQFEIVWTAVKPERPRPFPASRTSEQWRGLLNDLYTGWGNHWAPLFDE